MDPPLLLALGLYWLSTRDGNKLNLDRVLMDPDTKPFSWNRSGFDPGPTGLKNDDPDPDNVDPTDAGPKRIHPKYFEIRKISKIK